MKLSTLLAIILCAYGGLSGVGAQAATQAIVQTCDGSEVVCEPLVSPEIEVIKVGNVARYCGLGAEGCAKLTAGFKTCTIYIELRAKKGTLEHEMNHCYGWQHSGHGRRNHMKPWTPFPVVEQWLLSKP